MKLFLAAVLSLAAISASDAAPKHEKNFTAIKALDMCKVQCSRGAPACCRCFGGDWFGSPKGGHCG